MLQEEKEPMPITVKLIVCSLVISLVATLFAVFLEGREFEGMGFGDPVISGTNFIWALIVGWMVSDLFKRRNIEWSLLFVGIVILVMIVWDFIHFGMSRSLVFYSLEFVMFLISYCLIKTKQSKQWFASTKT